MAVKKYNVYFKRFNSRIEQQNKVGGVFEGLEPVWAPLPMSSSPIYFFFFLPLFLSFMIKKLTIQLRVNQPCAIFFKIYVLAQNSVLLSVLLKKYVFGKKNFKN